MASPAKVAPPATLPADFFDKQGGAPATLPGDFFDKQNTAPPPEATPSVAQTALSTVGDVLQGIGKGALHTLSPVLGGIAYGVQKGSQMLGVPPNLIGQVPESMGTSIADIRKQSTPENTPQRVGYGGEQAGEFMLPGGAEEAGAAKLAELAPRLGKAAEPLARIFTGALSSGAVNKAQGGGFGQGALLGGAAGAVGEGLRAAAPMLTEFAQGIHTPGFKTGKAILNETRGVMPGTIRKSAQSALDVLNPEMERVVGASQSPVSLAPARQVAAEQETKAFGRNEPRMYKGVKKLGRIVTHDLSGEPLPEEVPAMQALELRRGVDTALPKGSFHPESTNAFKGYRTPLRNALNESIGQVVPEYRPLASRISNLIPATEPSSKGFGHLWGPGAGAIFGGYYGARGGARNEGGITGALKGGLLGSLEGATAGTMLPAGINALARSSGVLPRVFTGAAAQALPRKKEK